MIELTLEEKKLLIKLLKSAIEFSVTSVEVDLDITPAEQERAKRLLRKLETPTR